MMKARDILLFNSSDQSVNVSVYFQKGTFWLTQKVMAELFEVNVPAISKHLKNIFETEELTKNSVVSEMEITDELEGNSGRPKISHTAATGKQQPGLNTKKPMNKIISGIKDNFYFHIPICRL